MQINAVGFSPDPHERAETTTRPDYVQVGSRVATLHYNHFVNGKSQTERAMVYVKCRPDLADRFTGRHMEYALARLRGLYLAGTLSLRSKIVAITDEAFFEDAESEQHGNSSPHNDKAG